MVVTRLSHTSHSHGASCHGQQAGSSGCQPGFSLKEGEMFQKPLTPGRRVACSSTPLHFLDLPAELIERVLAHLSYREISRARSVCQTFNLAASSLLTKSFYLLKSQTSQLLQSVRTQMPRRESLRKKHPLASQCDVLETVNMRFDLLSMTFGKHMERKFICFFPGEILDEVVRVTLLARSQVTASERLTDELCDLSTMAMEYFREHMDAKLRHSLLFAHTASHYDGWSGAGSTCASSVVDGGASSVGGGDDAVLSGEQNWDDDQPPTSSQLAVVNSRIGKLNKTLKKNNTQIVQLRREIRTQRQRSQEQSRVISEYASRIDEHDKKLDDASIKFSSLLQELSECRRELGQWRHLCHLSPPKPSPQPVLDRAAAAEAELLVDTDEERPPPLHGKRKLSEPEDRSSGSSRPGSSCKLRRRPTNN